MARSFVAASSQSLRNDTLTFPGTPFTMACWFWPNALTANMNLILRTNSGATNQYHRLTIGGADPGDPLYAVTSNASFDFAQSSSAPTTGAWNHGCGVWASASSRTVYLNGVQGTTNSTNRTPSGLNRVSIGGRGDTAGSQDYLDGRLDYLAVWSAALTSAEVEALARGAHPLDVRTLSLGLLWRPGYFDPEPCLVGAANASLTLINSPAFAAGAPVRALNRWRSLSWIEAAGGAVFTQNLSGSVGSSGAVPKQANRLLAGVI